MIVSVVISVKSIDEVRHHIAKHIYCRNPESLNPSVLAYLDEACAHHADHEIGGMGNVPFHQPHLFDPTSDDEVVLIEFPSSALLGWQWGQGYTALLTISKRDLAAHRFDRVTVDITNA